MVMAFTLPPGDVLAAQAVQWYPEAQGLYQGGGDPTRR